MEHQNHSNHCNTLLGFKYYVPSFYSLQESHLKLHQLWLASPGTLNVMFLLFMTTFSSLHYLSVSFEYQVGDNKGWVVPPANDTKLYNDWASENRFQVGDSIRFKYKKDSVMEVSEEEYQKCNSTHPNYFSNNGKSVFRLDHPGAFYFISGASGHCEKGQKMIVKVIMAHDEPSPSDHKSSASPAATIFAIGASKVAIFQFLSLLV